LAWYREFRRDLPWRRTRDPWAIWVSEVMLQQTRVETVAPYFERFMARFPTPLALAEASEDQVLAAWSGLGYYRRARMLHAGAREVADSVMPGDREGLLALPGVGRYTAGAIASIAFGESVGLVDGNVARVLARLFAIDDDMKRAGMRRAEGLAEHLVPAEQPGDWNQALMELGATVCTPRSPDCARCPISASCRAYAEGRAHELPRAVAKAKPTPRRLQALVATKAGRVLLARRRSEGLFGGLWEPPSVEGGPGAKASLFELFPVVSAEPSGRVTHVLSHRRLVIDVHVGVLQARPSTTNLPPVYEAADLFDEAGLERIGVATLGRKVLAAARAFDLRPFSGEVEDRVTNNSGDAAFFPRPGRRAERRRA
jgi:A/G-specific adenine glycosylase